jgi:arylsulfate sulfotransferase
MRPVACLCLSVAVVALIGCGGSGSAPPGVISFSVPAGSYPVSQSVSISASNPHDNIFYTTDGTVPSSASTRYSAPVVVSSTETLQAIAISGNETSAMASAAYTIIPPVVSATSFSFGQNVVGNALVKTVATITNGASAAAPVTLAISGDASFSLASSGTCGATLAGNSSCSINVSYDPTAAGTQQGSVAASIPGSPTMPGAIALSGVSGVMSSGVVTETINPQVALYTITPPFAANVTVNFGPDTNYGFPTSAVATPAAGGAVSIFVAGMKATSTYHMQAAVTFADGTVVNDSDHTFTTGALPTGLAQFSVTTAAGKTPQPGIELVDTLLGSQIPFATDLSGNVIWTYPFPDRQTASGLYPIKLMPNGNLVMLISPTTQALVNEPAPAGALEELRIIDLAGDIVQQLSPSDLNTRLSAAGFGDLNLQYFSHDVTLLPNGHMLLIASTFRPYTDLPGYPGVTNVAGDIIVDVDENMQPTWVFNEFDHFDVNRHPYMFPDWMHTNAIVYSPDDGNLVISLRHQNWVIKVNYLNGAGDGSVLWKLGYEGDFTLAGGTDPTDWFYAQHNPAFFSTNTTGSFSLAVMDNGNDRVFPDGTNCAVQGGSLCYTTVPVMQVDENAMTATLTEHQIPPGNPFSSFAGDVDQLANGDLEYDLAGVGANSFVYEMTQDATPVQVWEMAFTGTNTYRVFRLGSLYPGVQW